MVKTSNTRRVTHSQIATDLAKVPKNSKGGVLVSQEAFKVYDPHSTGFVDSEILRSIFENLGFGEISDEDLGILVETGDKDKDGRISLQDFRNMLAEGEKAAATASSTESAKAPKEAVPEDATGEDKAEGGGEGGGD
ncbi:hypothetical protein TrRE_jg11014 [Triparma retinervis]|uniref:EF-hand domain-containing protein n=1 Tax=Triparma retinervis TaxID=2557542 RepID=A0A9W7CIC0_9STRA|nr:hypothetical protein TrRE_jg11014 [Triparma retinervis]